MYDIFINTCYDNLSRKPFSIGENLSITIQLVKRQSCHHTETSQLICRAANQLTGFCMMATLVFDGLSWDCLQISLLILSKFKRI